MQFRFCQPARQSQIRFGEAGNFHLVFQQSEFQRLVAVNWNENAFALTFLGENMVAAVDALEPPSALLDEPDKFFAGDLFHLP
jgi:hypothetical protein